MLEKMNSKFLLPAYMGVSKPRETQRIECMVIVWQMNKTALLSSITVVDRRPLELQSQATVVSLPHRLLRPSTKCSQAFSCTQEGIG